MQITATRLVLYRLLILFVLLLPPFFFSLFVSPGGREILIILAFTGSELFLNLVYLLLVFRRPLLDINEGFFFLQNLADALLIFGVSLLSGGIYSPFFPLYYSVVLLASLAMNPRLALTFALLAGIFPVTLSYFHVYGVVPGLKPHGTTHEFVRQLLLQDLGFIFLFIILGIIPSRVRSRLKTTQMSLADVEKNFHDLRTLYTLVLEKIPSGISLITKNGVPVFTNPAGIQLLSSLSREEQQCFFATVIARGPESHGELKFEGEKENPRIFGYSFTPLPSLSWGDYLLVFHDLTTIHQLMEQKRREEQLQTLVRLSQNLAHELRNPLSALRQSLELLQQERDLSQEMRQLVGIQQQESERLETLVRNFLSYAHPEPRWIRPIEVKFCVEEFLHRYAHHPDLKDKRLDILGEDSILVAADEELFRQSLDNLLLNAFQWSPAGGVVTVEWKRLGENVEISITNTGPMIPPQHRERIFEPFFSLRPGGTGLGLAIAWSQIRAMKGELKLLRSDGERTTFCLTLPRGRMESLAAVS